MAAIKTVLTKLNVRFDIVPVNATNPDGRPQCPREIIELTSPAGFGDYLRKVAASWEDLGRFVEINREFALDRDFDSVPGSFERIGLTFPELEMNNSASLVDHSCQTRIR